MRTIRFSQLNVADSEQYCRAFLGVPLFFLLLCCFYNGRTSFANVHLQFLAQFFSASRLDSTFDSNRKNRTNASEHVSDAFWFDTKCVRFSIYLNQWYSEQAVMRPHIYHIKSDSNKQTIFELFSRERQASIVYNLSFRPSRQNKLSTLDVCISCTFWVWITVNWDRFVCRSVTTMQPD